MLAVDVSSTINYSQFDENKRNKWPSHRSFIFILYLYWEDMRNELGIYTGNWRILVQTIQIVSYIPSPLGPIMVRKRKFFYRVLTGKFE